MTDRHTARYMNYMTSSVSLPEGPIDSRIMLVGGHKVMLDADLADLYGVPTGALVQAVKRNLQRFPRTSCFSLRNRRLKP